MPQLCLWIVTRTVDAPCPAFALDKKIFYVPRNLFIKIYILDTHLIHTGLHRLRLGLKQHIYLYNTFLLMNKPSTSHLNVALDTASKVCVLQNSDVTAENLLYWVRVQGKITEVRIRFRYVYISNFKNGKVFVTDQRENKTSGFFCLKYTKYLLIALSPECHKRIK